MTLISKIFSENPSFTSKQRKNALVKLKVLKTIFENYAITINEVATKVNLSLPTLNLIMSELIQEGLLEQKSKGESIGGRKPNLYQIKNRILNILSIEIERFTVRLIVLDNNNEIVHEGKTYTNNLAKDADKIDNLIEIIRQYAVESKLDWLTIMGIGILMPGLINTETGENLTFYYAPNFNLRQHIKETFQKDVYILNDVKAAAISELNYGAAIGKKNVLIIQMDWGIGLGIIINGEVYMGNDGFSGEVGHMVFVEDGQLCYCGKRGCLETVASGVALVNRAKEDIAEKIPTTLTQLPEKEALLPKDIIEAANLGDQYAIDLLNILGKNLGKAISHLIQLFNPQMIVMSGKFADAGTFITLPIQLGIQTYTMNALKNSCELRVSTLGENGPVNGIVLYSITRYLDSLIVKMEK
ncbi:ROK family transcriptional regulator [Sphingobacterium psychroaquaticum]|uniref:ROK family transcriptional regulator n=1 Tax=Sphingobacterium psychroaquaticum TaxID=561061 RepID=UPI00106D7B10|nr:ROK family transcriptional regulator [Sphingobacterium psychroaquaticum]QBQ41968.1 ROK family transcriptional regulator [Sphingobacterium psychroaquaticum]